MSEVRASSGNDGFTCNRIEELVKNCTGFMRRRAFNQYYFGTPHSEHCDLLLSMSAKCLKLKKTNDLKVLEELRTEAEKFANLKPKSDEQIVNDVWELRTTPIDTWKSSN